ncbi:MAG: reverse transcriptase/maturase family protein [Dysgonamonadaceae bacterium]|jgi:retron-type reverse transcriptase|nr:reverse transcriptase/maturase family protein [Dysgonamonadaceae bacterium]
MKRKGNLYSRIYEPDNLYTAYYKAKKRKQCKREILRFSANYDENLRRIGQQLKDETFTFGNYHFFKVYDPKERVICASAFEERIVQHAVMNICEQDFERLQIFHSYACRHGKGTFAAVAYMQTQAKKHEWYLKLDVRKYFDSIDHDILKRQLARMYKDEQLLILFYNIIDSYSVEETGAGLPIGNLTSQHFANLYLSFADHYAIEELKTGYVRYMDDMFIFGSSYQAMRRCFEQFAEFMHSRLNLSLKPETINRCSHGVPALGFMIFPSVIRLNRRSKLRFIDKTAYFSRQFDEGKISEQEYVRHINALQGFIRHADTAKLILRTANS